MDEAEIEWAERVVLQHKGNIALVLEEIQALLVSPGTKERLTALARWLLKGQ